MPRLRAPDPPEIARAYARMRRKLAGVLTIGVTGTKGKTSTCEFIAQLMEAGGLLTAVSTTESSRIGSRYLEACDNAQELYSLVTRCQCSGVQCLVVELCSSALKWNLHRAFDLDVAVLTNIGTDHISDHGSRRNYVAVKQRMFRELAVTSASPRPVAVLNADDVSCNGFRKIIPREIASVLYGLRAPPVRTRSVPARLSASQIRHSPIGTSFVIRGLACGPLTCRTKLHGTFNVSNTLAAIACGVAIGAEPRRLVRNAAKLLSPAGRFEIVTTASRQHPAVLVDFAHTPESLQSALTAVRELYPHGRLHAVFGCGGDAYKRKRRLMGAIAIKLADTVTLTSDNPRSENPLAIAREILQGIPHPARKDVRLILDRNLAIQSSIEQAKAGDAVIILGKGSEQTQEISGRLYPFSDTQAARLALEARRNKGAPDKSLKLSATAAVCLDYRGELLFVRNPAVAHAPASLAKLMTLYLAFEDIARGSARLDAAITISSYAALTPHSPLRLRAGEAIRLRTLLEATAICSDNAAATAIAEHLNGDELSFLARMNTRARALGLTSTRFATPHGLPHRQQRSTALDLARLFLRLVHNHRSLGQILGRTTLTHRGHRYSRKLGRLESLGEIKAVKTGFTAESGFNLAVVAGPKGRERVVVVLGAPTRASSISDAIKILRFEGAR